VELLPFMEALCRERPSLHVYVLAWDYSVVYTLEREWMQSLKFDCGQSERIRYVLDGKHPVGASHHQKLVVIDGRLAFVGGADICDGRWDDRRHASVNAERVNRHGDPYKPYHEVIAFVRGGAVGRLEQVFRERWRRASGEELVLPELDAGAEAKQLDFENALAIDASSTAIARTYPAYEDEGREAVKEIRLLYEDAIAGAEHLVYIETQYITSRAIHEALLARLGNDAMPRLELVLVLPHGADTLKEQLVLGDAENGLLVSLDRAARQNGHTMRILFSAPSDGAEASPPTFIHSKLLIVDDRFMTLGSANCTNRSLGVDSELNLAWECEKRRDPLQKGIARLRASLLSEHAGIPHDGRLERIDGLAERIDELLAEGTRLRRRQLPELPEGSEAIQLVQLAFDPEAPPLEGALAELFGEAAEEPSALEPAG